jgi:hypothetical protein
MNKGYLVGGLAIIGAVALFAYLKPKGARRNSDGFFGASGRGMMSGGVSSANRPLCSRRNIDGSTSQYTSQGGNTPCPYGGRVINP